uniref:Gamma-glutamyltransferase 5 n=1 Tax=Cyclopterus lumpus TaxID=8103 RepID=A0A8C2ZYX6_CYCLU
RISRCSERVREGAVALVCLCIVSLVDRECPGGSFTHAAVAADSLRCSEVGRSMLQQGGSAVDGAIAALLCTSVVNPQSMGIGGGSILTIRNKKGKVEVYNFRETVPQSFKSNLLNDCSQWIGVPGELRGYEAVHKQYGKLPWAKLFEPTIKLAGEGIPLALKNYHWSLHSENKTVLSTGDILKFPKLAETMKTIAEQGADAFYTGKIGQDLIRDVEAAGGTLKREDLKSFQVRVEDAWTVPVGDTKMHFPPPPAGGPLLAFLLSLMKGFCVNCSLDGDQKIQTYHHFIEAAKFTNGQKKSITDPLFNDKKSADHLIDPSFINQIRDMIFSNRTHDNSYYNNAKPSRDHVGTTHVSVLDQDGLAVSATSTINQLFGGGIYSPRTGIILNNELSDFCGRSLIVTGERPPSSMIPVILESKSGGLLVIGGSGGSMITSAVALSIVNRLWLGMNLKDAIAAPIVFVDSSNNVNFEPDGIRALGHKPGSWKYFFNVVNAVEKENGCIAAVSDSRKNGMSAGY